MNGSRTLPALSAAAFFLVGCAETTVVTPLDSSVDSDRGGVIYTLPKTAIDVKITVTNTAKKAGKWNDYAYLVGNVAGTDVITKDSTEYKCSAPEITPVGISDDSKKFMAEIAGGPFSDHSMTLSFNGNGTLSSSVAESENKTSDFVVGSLELGAKVAGSMISFASATAGTPDANHPAPPDNIKDAVMASVKKIKTLLAARSGVVQNLNTPNPAFDSQLKEIDAELKPLLADFYGSTKTDTWAAQFRVIPKKADLPSPMTIPLFGYTGGGLHFYILPQVSPPPEWPASTAKVAGEKVVALAIAVYPRIDDKLAPKLGGDGDHGYYYNVPADGHIRLLDDSKVILVSDTQFGQFGSLAFLPASLGSRKAHIEVSLDGTSGGLSKVIINSTAYDPSQIAGIATAASGVIDATNPQTALARKAAEDKAKFESEQYERQLQVLQNQSGPLNTTLQ